ncbi:MAG TPA: ABC transporter permease [Verrucomicrobiales bacterium]|nr:ABC transporter permease [Verrucomicrobiales bacterium]
MIPLESRAAAGPIAPTAGNAVLRSVDAPPSCRLASARMSRLPFELFLALRYLRPKRTFVSVITLVSVVGVMLGVAVLIIVISVMTGFDKQLQERLLRFDAHMKILRREADGSQGLMSGYGEVIEKLGQHPEVVGAAPFFLGKVMIETQPSEGSSRIDAPLFRGVDPKLESSVSDLMDDIIAGEADFEGRTLMVGVDLAQALGLRVGDHVAVYSPNALKQMKESQGAEIIPGDDYRIAGIFDAGMYDYNYNIVATSLENAQNLYGIDESVHGILVRLEDPMRVGWVRWDLQELLGEDYRIRTWMEEHSTILTALQVEKNMMFYILFFIMIVAAFGIMNSQITFVVQKTREIGMLKALGTRRFSIVILFLGQSFVVGLIGVGLGFGLGMVALAYRNEFLDFMNRTTGLELFPAATYQFTRLPAVIDPGDIGMICGSALVICVIAGAIPAWTAARLRPVQALRYE